MTHEPLKPHRIIAARVRDLRKGRGSATWLAEQMTARGVKWDRSIVANFESGRRAYVTVEELLALADVLDVAPVYLVLPVDDEQAEVAVTPARTEAAWQVREWIRGRMPLLGRPGQAGQDARAYWAQRPAIEYRYSPLPNTPLTRAKEQPEPEADDAGR